jgi:peptidyl-prolyl cis-trans isomerase A (cyclophilin A)
MEKQAMRNVSINALSQQRKIESLGKKMVKNVMYSKKPYLAAFLVALLFTARIYAGTVVQFQLTSLGKSLGSFEVELYDSDKPITVSNFLAYIASNRYENSFFHRSVPGFVIQGGGYACSTPTSTNAISVGNVSHIPIFGTIAGEANVGKFYSNTNGTIAMALSAGPNTGTSEFYFNLADNNFLDNTSDGGPFTVFGRVIAGYGLLQSIQNYPIVNASAAGSALNTLPVRSGVNGATATPPSDDLIYYNLSIVGNTNRPKLAITTPKNGSATSGTNNVVAGTTTGALTLDGLARVPVDAVYYSLNGGPWIQPAESNHWATWNARVQLAAGSNTIAAYAVDTNGNASLTNMVEVFSIQLAPLTLQTSGHGSIIPNENAKPLIIGRRYSLAAKPSPGFAFQEWTDNKGNLLGTNATFSFYMTPGESLTAWFVDVTKPTVVITSPKANAKLTNSVIQATGTAKDNVGVAAVWYQMNTAAWMQASTTNNFARWTATNLTVVPGSNIFRVYAQDAAGNWSATNSVKFTGEVH